ncbi:MAG: serpin family protein [bacterium]|nr:serpin family protein [bacterium]
MLKRQGSRLAALLLSLLLVASACGGGEAEVLAAADVPRVAGDVTAQGEVAGASAAFALDLYRQLAKEGENLVFSPHSVALALAMTRAGAAGVTAEELDALLHLVGVTDPHGGFNALDQELSGRSGSYTRGDGTEAELQLTVANALWGQRGTKFEEGFLELLARQYGAGMRLVDYKADVEPARVEINEWIAEQTAGRIEDLISEGGLNSLTRLVLTNAVYLLAPWEAPFDEDGTSPGVFYLVDGSESTAELMHLFEPLRYTSGDGWQAVELPYAGRELSMIVIVPDKGRFGEIEAALSASRLDEIAAELSGTPVDLRFPKFEFRTQTGLLPALVALGLNEAVDPSRADFSGMTMEEKLFIADVIHEAFIAVDEEGTEAAAATAVVMAASAAPSEPVQLTVDRPFMFQIKDATTGSVLFFGRVMDPAA